MKKFFSLMVAVAAMFTFAACENSDPTPAGDQKLATPVVEIVDVTETGFTVQWGAISGAESYSVNMKGKSYTTAETSYTFTDLNAGEYSVRVMATGKGYKNSDFSEAKVAVVTGATSVSWFTQTLTLVPENDEYAAEGYYPYNAADFSWKGTGIVDLKYGMFRTADLDGASNADILANLNDLGAQFDAIIAGVNGDGVASVFEDLTGSTSYTLCTWVKNSADQEFLAKNEITTAEAELIAEAKAWLGDWTAYTEKLMVYAQSGITYEDTRRDFSLSITAYPGYADILIVDGFSELGAGLPAIGQVFTDGGKNTLGLLNQEMIDELDGGMYITWMAYCNFNGSGNFVLGNFPTYLVTMGETIEGSMYSDTFNDGTPFTVVAMDLLGWDGNTSIGFLQDQSGNVANKFKVGPIKGMTKAAASASVASKKANNYSVVNKFEASVVF